MKLEINYCVYCLQLTMGLNVDGVYRPTEVGNSVAMNAAKQVCVMSSFD